MTFEIDPTLVADAIREGRKLNVEIRRFSGRLYPRVTLGAVSPYVQPVAKAEQVKRAMGRG